jgi:sterol desaturase/sphingolipid hydroxylase (fatty acid hydroxylase superfamily)
VAAISAAGGHALITQILLLYQALLVAWERLAPRRRFTQPFALRWLGNLGMVPFDLLLLRVFFVAGPTTALAVRCESSGTGLFHALPEPLPTPVQVALGFVAFDLCMWLQHWTQHKVPLLWRSHRVHHTDLDLDVTTSFRFHPFEALYTVCWRLALIASLGLPLPAVLLYEIVLKLTSSTAHASLRIPRRVEGALRRLFVTPDLHRIHHSAHELELDRNFASVFSFWDRVFGTYQAEPARGHADMALGLPGQHQPLQLPALLLLPFRRL